MTPPLLKEWQDAVLTRMFYLADKLDECGLTAAAQRYVAYLTRWIGATGRRLTPAADHALPGDDPCKTAGNVDPFPAF